MLQTDLLQGNSLARSMCSDNWCYTKAIILSFSMALSPFVIIYLNRYTDIAFFKRYATILFYRHSIDYYKIQPLEWRYNVGYDA